MLEVPADTCDRVASASELQVASVPVLEHPIIRDDDECVHRVHQCLPCSCILIHARLGLDPGVSGSDAGRATGADQKEDRRTEEIKK